MVGVVVQPPERGFESFVIRRCNSRTLLIRKAGVFQVANRLRNDACYVAEAGQESVQFLDADMGACDYQPRTGLLVHQGIREVCNQRMIPPMAEDPVANKLRETIAIATQKNGAMKAPSSILS